MDGDFLAGFVAAQAEFRDLTQGVLGLVRYAVADDRFRDAARLQGFRL